MTSSFIHQLSKMVSATDDESQSNAITRLSTALFVVFLLIRYKSVQSLSEKDAIVLHEALLLRTPTEDKEYIDIDVVARSFSKLKWYV